MNYARSGRYCQPGAAHNPLSISPHTMVSVLINVVSRSA